MKLDKNPFVITALVGQELLNTGHFEASMKVLEAAREIGTDSSKLMASLMQALGRVHWLLKNTDKAFSYMEQDLKINESTGEPHSIIRAHDILGVSYFSIGHFEESIRHHHQQLGTAQNHGNVKEMVHALNRLGPVFCSLYLYKDALQVYKDSLKLAKEMGDQAVVLSCYINLAQTHLDAGDLDKAIQWYHQELQLAKDNRSKAEAYCHLGHACHLKGNYDQSMMFYQQLLSIAVQMDNMVLKAQAYGGMGQANRALGNLWPSQTCREQQLKLCQDVKDEVGQLVALTHLGHIQRAGSKLSQAMQYYNRGLQLAVKLQDKEAEAKAYSCLGSCHSLVGNIREAINFYQKELTIVVETEDKISEALCLGHLGMALVSLEDYQTAQEHLKRSLLLSEEIGDSRMQYVALSNLSTCYASTRHFSDALVCLNRALKPAQELKDLAMESNILHNMGLCYEGLGSYEQAIKYFHHDFIVARDAQDKERMTLACEKLVKAHKETGDTEQANIYQRMLTNISEENSNASGKCSEWNQAAEEALSSGEFERAIESYENLLKEAKNRQHSLFEGIAYRGLGNSHMATGNFEHALSYYQRDLQLCKAAGDLHGECDAYNNMGAANNSLNQHNAALECFEQQLRLSKQLDNPVLTLKAYSCLGIVHRNMFNFRDALHYHQLQVSSSQQLKENLLEQAIACANLGDTHEIIGNYSDAIRMQEQHLALAQKTNNEHQQLRALASLGRAHRGLGAIRKALHYFQQRLKLAHDQEDDYIEAETYADIGDIHLLLKDYSHASEAFSKQQHISKQLQDSFSEALAASGLGEVQFRMGNYRDAIEHHLYDLNLSNKNGLLEGEIRALGNIAEVYEAMKDYKNAIIYREKQISAADTLRDPDIHAMAFTGLGKIHLRIGDFPQAVSLLKQALSLVNTSGRPDLITADTEVESEAKIRFYLGQAFYHSGQSEQALSCLNKSLPLFEHMREMVSVYDHSTKQTLELLPVLYQTLICVLVKLDKVEAALEMAEREKNRTLVDSLMERDVNKDTLNSCGLMKPFTPHSSWIQDAIDHIQCPVVYYAVALRHIFIWLLHPKTGIVQFQRVGMNDLTFANSFSDSASIFSENSSTYLQPLADSITVLRESLGVIPRRHSAKSMGSAASDDSGEDNESVMSAEQYLSPHRGSSSRNSKVMSLQTIHELYDLLIRPIECAFPRGKRDQVLIIPDKDLYLLPYPLLKAEESSQHLFQQFHLHFSTSLQAVVANKNHAPSNRRRSVPTGSGLLTPKKYSVRPKSPSLPSMESSHSNGVQHVSNSFSNHLVLGNPSIPVSGSECNWQQMVGAEKEVRQVAEKLETVPLTGMAASKHQVLERLPEASSIYISTNISWKRAHFVLAANNKSSEALPQTANGLRTRRSGDGSAMTKRGVADGSAVGGMPEPSKYLLSLSDILDARLQAKLVVISGSHRTDTPHLSAGSLLCMADGILASGAHTVLIPLWPTSHQASRLMMNAFYSSLLYGSKTSRALSYAMQVCYGLILS